MYYIPDFFPLTNVTPLTFNFAKFSHSCTKSMHFYHIHLPALILPTPLSDSDPSPFDGHPPTPLADEIIYE